MILRLALLIFIAPAAFGLSTSTPLRRLQNEGVRSIVALKDVAGGRCTGTLITRRHVLTAAHCLDHHDKRTMGVFLMKDPATVAREVAIKSVHVHELWAMGDADLRERIARFEAFTKRLAKIHEDSNCNRDVFFNWRATDLLSFYTLMTLADRTGSINYRTTDRCERESLKVWKILEANTDLLEEGVRTDLIRVGDLAVLELAEEIRDPSYEPMPIDFGYEPGQARSEGALIAGYGLTAIGAELKMPVNPLLVGSAKFMKRDGSDKIVFRGNAVICPGDSGGPTAKLRDSKLVLVGVNAGMTECNHMTGESYVTHLAIYREWIRSLVPGLR